jgi:transposase
MKGWEMINKVKAMILDGYKVSAISRKLKMDRKTVRKYRDMDMDEIAEYRRIRKRRKLKVDIYKSFIDKQLELMEEDGVINAQAIFDKIITKGFSGSPRTLRRYVSSRIGKRKKQARTYEPFETEPGKQAMVDMGESRKVWLNMKRSVMYFLVMTLGYSRKIFVEWYDRPVDTEMFIQFHQKAFSYFGGIPEEIVYDQTKLAVIRERYGEVDFNREFFGFSLWSEFKNFICNKSDPETKGKVESSVRYVKRGFLPGRRFFDGRDLDRQWFEWLHTIADVKPNETTGEAPRVRFEKERSCLKPLRDSIYTPRPAFKEQPVYKDGFVKVLGNRYSVPWEYHRKKVKIRLRDLTVEIHAVDCNHIYTHDRCFEKNKRIRVRAHYHRPYKEPTEMLSQNVLLIYNDPRLLMELKTAFPRHYREQCRQLIRLTDTYTQDILRQACYSVLSLGGVSYSKIKQVAYHFHQQAYKNKCEPMEIIPSCHEIPELDLEQRPSEYYDQVTGVSS